jgi:UDP-glucose 4-epimerase
MRVLITGGAGYIGSHATRLFMARGHDVWVFDNLCRGHRQAVPSDKLIIGDLADRHILEEALRQRKIEAIAHFASLTYVGESVTDPGSYYENNVAGTINLLEAARNSGVSRLVFSSTAAVYGNPVCVPIVESTPCRPINPYGKSKLMVENILADYASAYGLGYTCLRYFNAAGANPDGDIGECHDPETHLIPVVLQVAMGLRSHVEVFGTDFPTSDGTCVRDYVHVDDLAEAHLLALEQIQPGVGRAFNLGSGRGSSVREVIDICREVTGRDIPVKWAAARQGDPAELVASQQSAMADLNWKPKYTSLRDIIRTAWNWHQKHPSGYETDSH